MKKLLAFFIVILLAAGCSRYIESEDLDFDLGSEPPKPENVTLMHIGEGIMLTWDYENAGAGISYKVYYSIDSLENSYALWETTTEQSSTITSLKSGQLYYFAVSAVNTNGLESKRSEPLSTNYGILSININGGSKYTNSRNVSIAFVIPVAATLVQLSEDPDFSDSRWDNYAPVKSFQLSQDDGSKYVYARLKFEDGSESNTIQPIADTIILDTETSIDTVYFTPTETILARDSVVNFVLVATEGDGTAQISFPGKSSFILNYDANASDTTNDKYVYSRDFTVPANLEVVDGVVQGHFYDAAGNSAEVARAPELLNISNPPTPVSLVAVTESSEQIRLNWSEAANEDFAAYHIYRDTVITVSSSSEPITVINNRYTLTYGDTNLEENTAYYYRIYVFDNTGLSAASGVAMDTTLVNTPPGSVILAARVEEGSVTLTWTANSDDDFATYRIFRETSAISFDDIPNLAPLEIINSQTTTQFLDNPLAGTYHYVVCVFDRQGKYSMSADVVVSN